MAYSDTEEAVSQSLLVELYDFKIGVLSYRYTSSDRDQIPSEASGIVYQSEYIKSTSIGQNDELNKENITISVHRDNAVAKLFWGRPPDQTVVFTLFRYHLSGVPGTTEQDVVAAWSGRVLSCSFQGNEAEMICESTATSMKQTGLSRQYSMGCPHVLYGVNCGVIKSNQEFYTSVSVVTDNVVEATGASAYADDHFTGGYINWLGLDGNQQSRMVLGHTGEQLTLDWEVDGMAVLDQIWVYPGCKRNTSDCFNKFLNIENYGGFPYMPEKNPYEVTVY